jgi:hypothetical protein
MKTTPFRFIAGLGCALALNAGLAQAQTANTSPAAGTNLSEKTLSSGKNAVSQLLILLDTDQNGRVSKKEFMDFMSAEFDRLDTDHSGELDVKELKSLRVNSRHPGGGGK